ncbi:DNA oxidative demethylase ALKBH2 isoform X2 [Aristolochia californica]|uniref:DNA oxidative demethylase ALKBH2 isoform X2 n=1 Tax=Aristolochia californica TaxID=171875 RepID=UPI0035E26295
MAKSGLLISAKGARLSTSLGFCPSRSPGICSIILTSKFRGRGLLFASLPRDTCYIASEGLPELRYSGYQPHAYSWDDYPPLKDILAAVHKALPGSNFNSLLLNRYKNGSDYVAWHADDEKLYGLTPEIASVSFGCEREFLLKKKPSRTTSAQSIGSRVNEGSSSRHSFILKHGSLLVMRGYTQRDWLHSVPKRVKAHSVRINLTFRHVPI